MFAFCLCGLKELFWLLLLMGVWKCGFVYLDINRYVSITQQTSTLIIHMILKYIEINVSIQMEKNKLFITMFQ